MVFFIKTFSELTNNELYEILQLRSEVFVVEQNCIYQDLDGKDQKALHVFSVKDNIIITYTRIFKPGDYFKKASIGRVVVLESERKNGHGYKLMKKSIEALKSRFKVDSVSISAQVYLKFFYESLGFKKIGDEYLEDGIPHIEMLRD